MATLLEVTRWTHAGLGAICLISGVIALGSRKAAGQHPRAGRIFAVSLVLVYAAILLNIVVKQNVFMLGIGWLAVYAAADGWRALRRFKGLLTPAPLVVDYVLGGITAVGAASLALFGVLLLRAGNGMGWVCIAFSALAAALVRSAAQRFRGAPTRTDWLAAHVGLMSGAFSAALTAFFAIQFSGRLGAWEWVVWVAPVLVMSVWARRQEAMLRGSGPT